MTRRELIERLCPDERGKRILEDDLDDVSERAEKYLEALEDIARLWFAAEEGNGFLYSDGSWYDTKGASLEPLTEEQVLAKLKQPADKREPE